MNLRLLKYFITIAQEKNISAAARTLHLTQPTLSRQMKEFEEELDTTLFIRGNRKITLTDDGQYLYRRAKEIIHLVEKTERNFIGPNQTVSGEITIGCAETESMRMIAKLVKKLQEQYPDIKFHLYSGNAEDIAVNIKSGLFDFAILIDPTDKTEYDFLQIPFHDYWGVLLRKDYPLADKQKIQPSDLIREPLLVSNQNMVNNMLSAWIGQNMDSLNIVATYNLIFNAALMVEEGVGLALCLDDLVNTSAESNLCFKRLEPSLPVTVNLAWKKNQIFSKASEVFLNEARKQFSNDVSSLKLN